MITHKAISQSDTPMSFPSYHKKHSSHTPHTNLFCKHSSALFCPLIISVTSCHPSYSSSKAAANTQSCSWLQCLLRIHKLFKAHSVDKCSGRREMQVSSPEGVHIAGKDIEEQALQCGTGCCIARASISQSTDDCLQQHEPCCPQVFLLGQAQGVIWIQGLWRGIQRSCGIKR